MTKRKIKIIMIRIIIQKENKISGKPSEKECKVNVKKGNRSLIF